MKPSTILSLVLCGLFASQASASTYAVEWSFGDKDCDPARYTDMVHQVFRKVGLIPDNTYIQKSTSGGGRNLRSSNGERELQYAMCEWCETRFWGPLVCTVYYGVCNGRRELDEGSSSWTSESYSSMNYKCKQATEIIEDIDGSCDMESFSCNILESK